MDYAHVKVLKVVIKRIKMLSIIIPLSVYINFSDNAVVSWHK